MWVNSCQIIFERRLQKCDVLMNSAIPASRSRFFNLLLLCNIEEKYHINNIRLI